MADSPFAAADRHELCVYTLGGFRLLRNGHEIEPTAWTREKALHLFQFMITARRTAVLLHKERIVDDLWPEADAERGDRDFKVALNAVNNALEPERAARATPRYVVRSDLAYGLAFDRIWVDADAFEAHVAAGSAAWTNDNRDKAIACYTQALSLYRGDYLPERRYEDWSSAERERLQVLALNVMTTLAGLLLEHNPLESLRLTQRVLAVDPIWEDAYRIQMQAYLAQGNRPLALRTYEQCAAALERELEIPPLPETVAVMEAIRGVGKEDEPRMDADKRR